MVFKSCNCDLEMCVLLEEECRPALIRLHPKRIHTNTQPTRRDIFRHRRTHSTALCPPPLSSHTHVHPQGKTAIHQDFFSSHLRVLDMEFLKIRKSATGIKRMKINPVPSQIQPVFSLVSVIPSTESGTSTNIHTDIDVSLPKHLISLISMVIEQ